MGLLERLSAWLLGARPADATPWRFVDDAEWVGRLDPADVAQVQVYADWLEERGDSRAQLIHRSAAPAFDAFIDTHRTALFGEFGGLLRPREGRRPALEVTWQHGVAVAASVRSENPWFDLPELLGLPVFAHLRQLGVGDGVVDVADGLTPPPTVRALVVGDFEPHEQQLSWASVGDLGGLWPLFPALERLTVRGVVNHFGVMALPHLTDFTWETCTHGRAQLDELLRAQVPALQSLTLWFGDARAGADCTAADVAALLRVERPHLRRLGLKNFEHTDAVLDALWESPLLPQLEHLDLSLGLLSDDGAEQLLRHGARLAHLRTLDLSANALSPRLLPQLTTLCAEVRVDGQRLDRFEEDLRFVAVTE